MFKEYVKGKNGAQMQVFLESLHENTCVGVSLSQRCFLSTWDLLIPPATKWLKIKKETPVQVFSWRSS